MSPAKHDINRFYIPLFVTIGYILLLFAHINWFLVGKQVGYKPVVSLKLDVATVLQNIALFAIIMFVLSFYLVSLSPKYKHKSFSFISCNVLFPAVLFFVIIFFGSISIYLIPLAWHWSNIACLVLLGGIAAFSWYLVLYFDAFGEPISDELKIVFKKDKVSKEIYSKKLEVEHAFFQNILQWITWSMIVFLTGVVVVGHTNPVEEHPIELRVAELQNTVFLVIWLVIGIWFGVIAPICRHMSFLRKSLEQLSTIT